MLRAIYCMWLKGYLKLLAYNKYVPLNTSLLH